MAVNSCPVHGFTTEMGDRSCRSCGPTLADPGFSTPSLVVDAHRRPLPHRGQPLTPFTD
ncbi:MAG: hypothetical protein GY745_05370 [Actinomycetia bacterium]|nr:hypothetical protein [Actinomycetes bacterium]MCP4084465.1 hypothetical protein [Actinomycetes bacterium]